VVASDGGGMMDCKTKYAFQSVSKRHEWQLGELDENSHGHYVSFDMQEHPHWPTLRIAFYDDYDGYQEMFFDPPEVKALYEVLKKIVDLSEQMMAKPTDSE
jgi:hypothetical protein